MGRESFQRRALQSTLLQSTAQARSCSRSRAYFKPMLRHLMTRWGQARGTAQTAIRECVPLHPRTRRRASRTLRPGAQLPVQRLGPVKDCEVRIGKHTVKEMRRDAQRRYEHDIGAAHALEFLSYHVEASYLPGEARTPHLCTILRPIISQKLATRLAGGRPNRVGMKASPAREAFDQLSQLREGPQGGGAPDAVGDACGVGGVGRLG